MDINFTYYEIDSGDIYEYERQRMLSEVEFGIYQEDLAEKILDTLEILILKKNKPFTIYNFDGGDNSYYLRYENQYKNHKNSIKGRFKIGFFPNVNSFYDLNSKIKFSKDDSYYLFFFALKLRQYETDSEHLFDFLNYQKKNNYHKQSELLKETLIKIIQHPFIPETITAIINQWIDKKLTKRELNIPVFSSEKKDVPLLIKELIVYNCIKPVIADKLQILIMHNRIQNQIEWTDSDWKLCLLIDAFHQATFIQLLPDETIYDFIVEHFTYKNRKINKRILTDNSKRALKTNTNINIYKKYSANIEKAFSFFSSNIQQK